MAKCDRGYLCSACGEEVECITESSLYLRYVIGEIDPEQLHLVAECHLHCNPSLAQFIDDTRHPPIATPDGLFSLASLDPEFVRERTELVSQGYRRLWEIRSNRAHFPAVEDYMLAPFREKWR